MITYLRSTLHRRTIRERDGLTTGSWLRVERPTENEIDELITLGIDEDTIRDALDPHEIPRLDDENGWTYFITRLPDTDDDFNDYTTPILFAMNSKYIATVSRDTLGRMWQPFIEKTPALTSDGIQTFMMMMDAIAVQYTRRVSTINRQMRAATTDVRTLRSRDIVTLTGYERKLNDYLDALMPTNTALLKLVGNKTLNLDEDDRDLAEDLVIDLEQVIARCKALLRTITNVRDTYRAVMDTRLNETIRLLTVITLALTIPMMLSGIYGMNVSLPFEHEPWAFSAIIGVSIIFSGSLGYYFLKKR